MTVCETEWAKCLRELREAVNPSTWADRAQYLLDKWDVSLDDARYVVRAWRV